MNRSDVHGEVPLFRAPRDAAANALQGPIRENDLGPNGKSSLRHRLDLAGKGRKGSNQFDLLLRHDGERRAKHDRPHDGFVLEDGKPLPLVDLREHVPWEERHLDLLLPVGPLMEGNPERQIRLNARRLEVLEDSFLRTRPDGEYPPDEIARFGLSVR